MEQIQKYLNLISGVAQLAPIPYAGLAAGLAKVAVDAIAYERQRNPSMSVADIYARAGVTFDEAEHKLLEDIAAGE